MKNERNSPDAETERVSNLQIRVPLKIPTERKSIYNLSRNYTRYQSLEPDFNRMKIAWTAEQAFVTLIRWCNCYFSELMLVKIDVGRSISPGTLIYVLLGITTNICVPLSLLLYLESNCRSHASGLELLHPGSSKRRLVFFVFSFFPSLFIVLNYEFQDCPDSSRTCRR